MGSHKNRQYQRRRRNEINIRIGIKALIPSLYYIYILEIKSSECQFLSIIKVLSRKKTVRLLKSDWVDKKSYDWGTVELDLSLFNLPVPQQYLVNDTYMF